MNISIQNLCHLVLISVYFHCRYLSLGNLRDANVLMDEIKKQVESKKLEFPKSDLIQFINYLLQTYVQGS